MSTKTAIFFLLGLNPLPTLETDKDAELLEGVQPTGIGSFVRTLAQGTEDREKFLFSLYLKNHSAELEVGPSVLRRWGKC